jgi:hypothetical protein
MVGDFDQLAASLRADARDADAFFDVLVVKLQGAFPDQVEIKRGGLLGRGAPRAVSVTLGEHRYEAERANKAISCRRRMFVRGIALKSEDLNMDAWIDALSADLVEQAGSSARARDALERLL